MFFFLIIIFELIDIVCLINVIKARVLVSYDITWIRFEYSDKCHFSFFYFFISFHFVPWFGVGRSSVNKIKKMQRVDGVVWRDICCIRSNLLIHKFPLRSFISFEWISIFLPSCSLFMVFVFFIPISFFFHFSFPSPPLGFDNFLVFFIPSFSNFFFCLQFFMFDFFSLHRRRVWLNRVLSFVLLHISYTHLAYMNSMKLWILANRSLICF